MARVINEAGVCWCWSIGFFNNDIILTMFMLRFQAGDYDFLEVVQIFQQIATFFETTQKKKPE